jgi:hypothetical protein
MAATDDNASAHLLMDAVSTFGTAYAATQESFWSNATNIAAIQGQLQMPVRQLALASCPSNSHDAPRMDATAANNAAETTMAALVAATAAVVAITKGRGSGSYNAVVAVATVATFGDGSGNRGKSDPKQPLASKAVQELELLLHPWRQH